MSIIIATSPRLFEAIEKAQLCQRVETMKLAIGYITSKMTSRSKGVVIMATLLAGTECLITRDATRDGDPGDLNSLALYVRLTDFPTRV